MSDGSPIRIKPEGSLHWNFKPLDFQYFHAAGNTIYTDGLYEFLIFDFHGVSSRRKLLTGLCS